MRSTTVGLTFVLLAVISVIIVCSLPLLVLSQSGGVDASIRSELTLQERRGKAFYLRGESASGQEIIATLSNLEVPAASVPCAGCHGNRGEGKTEGSVTAGNLTWSFLSRPSGHKSYSEVAFGHLLTSGVDPAGHKLSATMPIYRMPMEDIVNLIAYLKRIGTEHDPGLSDKSILLGTLVPEKDALNGLGQSMVDVLQAYFDDINRRGGISNRRIELRIRYGNSKQTVSNLKQLVDDEQVFAMVSGLTAGVDDEISALTMERELPFVGPSTLLPYRRSPLNRYLFYLLPGLNEQGRALVNAAARKTDPTTLKAAIVSPDAELNRNVGGSIQRQTNDLHWAAATTTYYSPNAFNATLVLSELNQKGINTMFFLGLGVEAAAILKEAERVGWQGKVYMMGTFIGRNIVDNMPSGMKDRVFIVFPTIPADVSPAGAAEFKDLLESHKLARSNAAAQVSALAAAKIVVHALELCGKDLSRERFITALEGLREFDTGFTPKITFGPNRRIGSLGAYVVTIDSEKKLFPASVEWIAVD